MKNLIEALSKKDPELANRVSALTEDLITAKVTDRVIRNEIVRVLKKADKLKASAMKLKELLKERTINAGSSDEIVNLEQKVDKLAVMLPGLVHALKVFKI